MIPAIGLIISFYVFFRVVETIDRKEAGKVTKFFAYVSGIVTFICLFAFFQSSNF